MTVMRYAHGLENLDQNAVNFISYEDEEFLLSMLSALYLKGAWR